MKNLKNFLRKNFLTGLLVLVPLGVTIYVLEGLLGWIDGILGGQVKLLLGEYYFPGLGIVTLFLLIIFVGAISSNYVGYRIVRAWDELVQRVPLVRGVYSTTKQVMQTFSVKHNFHGVALVEYPRKGCYSVGFVTGEASGETFGLEGKHLTVFVPTTPNPTAGFLLVLPEAEVRQLDMTVEEGMKFIISLGLVSLSERETLKLKGKGGPA